MCVCIEGEEIREEESNETQMGPLVLAVECGPYSAVCSVGSRAGTMLRGGQQQLSAPQAPGPDLPGPSGDRAGSCRVTFPRVGELRSGPSLPPACRVPRAAPGVTSSPSWPVPAGLRPKGPAVACGGHTRQGCPGLRQSADGPLQLRAHSRCFLTNATWLRTQLLVQTRETEAHSGKTACPR